MPEARGCAQPQAKQGLSVAGVEGAYLGSASVTASQPTDSFGLALG